jgi:hypothetical protein
VRVDGLIQDAISARSRGGGRWLVLGDSKLDLPLLYIDNVVKAIMAAVAKKLTQSLFQ